MYGRLNALYINAILWYVRHVSEGNMSDELTNLEKFTAEQFKLQPAIVYRKADLQGVVEITHAHYPDKCILLVSKKREPIK